jgi:hypothetical protein
VAPWFRRPPPPPIDLKFFGFANKPESQEDFLSQGEDVTLQERGEPSIAAYRMHITGLGGSGRRAEQQPADDSVDAGVEEGLQSSVDAHACWSLPLVVFFGRWVLTGNLPAGFRDLRLASYDTAYG